MPTLRQAKKVCAQIAEAELALRQNRDWIFDHAWELGKIWLSLKNSSAPAAGKYGYMQTSMSSAIPKNRERKTLSVAFGFGRITPT